jgi:hypothetical protein
MPLASIEDYLLVNIEVVVCKDIPKSNDRTPGYLRIADKKLTFRLLIYFSKSLSN